MTFAILLPGDAAAKNGAEPLNHYGLTSLQDTAIGAKLGGRFKARGQPVFLIHDPYLGLMQGDIMRFQDKAVLVDADVWQTLNDEGALGRLKAAPILRVQAKATVSTWETRSKLVTGLREKKAYQLGAELLKILEETFGGIPSRQQMAIVFDGPSLILLAPDEFLDQLKYSTVRRVPPAGRPQFIVPAPGRIFAGLPFRWQAWAADPAEPAGMLRYTLFGELPKGLAWDPATHALQGTPEEEGQWRLTAEARNGTGAFDTVAFNLAVRRNVPPWLAHPPKPVAVAGQMWSFRAEAVDIDHEGSQVRVSALKMPAGMEFDSASRQFRWYPGDSLAGQRKELAVRLEDQAGGVTDSLFSIKVIPASDMLWSEGIKPALPWDTLKQGKTYTWEAGASAMAWAQQGITLTGVAGPDFTEFREGSLTLRPMAPGAHVLTFAFDVQGKRLEQAVTLPVRPDLAPRFASEVGAWRVRTGQPASYRPVAVDDEGDPVSLRAESQDGRLAWDGERLRLSAEEPGTYAARLIASDPAGHSSGQWVAYKVERAERPTAWFLENRIEGGISTWTIAADLGTGRIGLFTPALDRIGVKGASGARFWPYLFFGGNLLGRANENLGRRLWIDAGVTMRMPDPKVATGGVMGRLLGEWTFPGQVLGKIEFEMQGHANQAIVVADTSNLHVIYGDAILEFSRNFTPIVDGIIKEATARDNIVLFSRLEGWSRLGAGFWAGPAIWREEIPNAHRYFQRIGAGLRYQARLGEAIACNSLRAGWGSGDAGWTVYWTGRVSLNSPF
ncbi:MAG TPA: putative Ig domain-containing protein [Fibrobacteria bacterium]|nr:putative Ig domain-containing protein [Fibrobacteria bacterium]